MGDWMPQLNPQLLQAAMARQQTQGQTVTNPRGVGINVNPGNVPVQGAMGPGQTIYVPPENAEMISAMERHKAGAAPPVMPQQPLAPQRVATTPPPVPAAPAAMPPPASSAPPQATPQATPPRPSDDPAISPEMRKALQPTQDAMGALDAEQKHATDLEGQAAALHAPTHEQYKPPLWKKIAAPFVGALMGRNAEPGLDQFMNGPYNRAMQDYQGQRSTLQQQLDAERGINIPLAQDRARVSQEGFRNWMEIQKEYREKTAFDNETGEKVFTEPGPDGQPHYFQTTKGGIKREVPEPKSVIDDRRKREEDDSTPSPRAVPEPDPDHPGQYRILTKGGGYMPAPAKNVEEGAMRGDPRATTLFNREHPGREPKEGTEPGSWSAADKREFDSKTRRFNGQIDALNHQRANLSMLPESPATKPMLDNVDKQLKVLYDQVDAVEQHIESRKAKGPGAAASPGRVFNVTKWQAANPKGDVTAARAEAKRQGLSIKE